MIKKPTDHDFITQQFHLYKFAFPNNVCEVAPLLQCSDAYEKVVRPAKFYPPQQSPKELLRDGAQSWGGQIMTREPVWTLGTFYLAHKMAICFTHKLTISKMKF